MNDPAYSLLGALLSYLFALRAKAPDLQAKAESARLALAKLTFNQQVQAIKTLAEGGEHHDFYKQLFPGLYTPENLAALWPEYASLVEAARLGRTQLELAA